MLIGSSSATGLGPQAKALSIEISNYIITANSVACHPYFSDAARTLLQLLFFGSYESDANGQQCEQCK